MIDLSISADSPVVQFTQAGGHRVCYVTGGNESSSCSLREKPRLLLLHGWISSHQLYQECWAGLGDMAHYCAVDLIGFGDSDKPSPKTCRYDPAWYSEGLLSDQERKGLAAMVELSERLSLVRAEALHLLGRN